MNVESYLSEGTRLELTEAMLLYSDTTRQMATLHKVLVQEGVPTILPGECLTQEALETRLRFLSNAPLVREVLPPEVLCDTGVLCWWKTATRLPIFFNTKDQKFNQEMSGKVVLHPPLLFLASPARLRVFALPVDTRPTAETILQKAPYYNLYEGGAMCTGNVRLPEVTQARDIPLWEKAFFETNFTHTNAGTVTAHKGGHDGLWREMAKPARTWKESREVFPAEYLISSKRTLQQVVSE